MGVESSLEGPLCIARSQYETPIAVAQIRQLALPFGHYRNVTFTVRQSTEARAIAAIVGAEFVAGKFRAPADSEEFAKCYVKRWAVRIDVSPY